MQHATPLPLAGNCGKSRPSDLLGILEVTMADHAEVEYATATGNDYPEHESTYLNFISLVEVTILTVITILIGLVLVGVKDAAAIGWLLLFAAIVSGFVGSLSYLGWRAPALILVIALIVW